MTDRRGSFTDIKPNNVLISYTRNLDGIKEIREVTLSDTEDAAKVKNGEGIFTQIGNVLWRSPEAQTGTRVGKASDIWSFGVTVSPSSLVYGLTCTCHLPNVSFLLTIGPPPTTGHLRHYQNGHLCVRQTGGWRYAGGRGAFQYAFIFRTPSPGTNRAYQGQSLVLGPHRA